MNDHRLYGLTPPGPSRSNHNDRDTQTKRPPPPPVTATTTVQTSTGKSNKLLAGYMAHEFRTKGTVLGHELEGETAERVKLRPVVENERYKELTSLLMMKNDGGVHIPGVVNPAQLARWIQM